VKLRSSINFCTVGTNSIVVVHEVDACSSKHTRRRVTFVDDILTQLSRESDGAVTRVAVDSINTSSSILTGRVCTVVDVDFTVGSIESGKTLASVGIE
jgi:hypothetical protein